MQTHGFARNVDWELVEAKKGSMKMRLTPSAYTREMWDDEFKLVEKVSVLDDGKALVCELDVKNTGTKPWSFTGSFHTYLRANIDKV